VSISLYLFGTSHKYQCGGRDCSRDQADAFATQVREICIKYNIKRITEEMTLDGRKRYEVSETIAKGIASDLMIHHHEVDLSECERNALSIVDSAVLKARLVFRSRDGGEKLRIKFDKLTDQVRERVWVARIMNSNSWPVLFILGADHISTFSKVWRSLGGNVEVLWQDYTPCTV